MAVSEKNRLVFLDQPESRRLEFKEAFPKGDQVARTAVAFANGAGGRIVFGVKDSPRTVIGISDDQLFKTEERITNCIFDLCTPSIVPEIYIQSVEGKLLLVVELYPGSQKPYGLKKPGRTNEVYIRAGASNRKASPETIEALERQRRKVSFTATMPSSAVISRWPSTTTCWKSPARAPFRMRCRWRNSVPVVARSAIVLAPIFKDLKQIEAWGSGIQKMRKELEPYPEIELVLLEAGNTFQVQFLKKDLSRAESGQSGTEPEAESLQQRVMNVLAQDALSKSEIANKVGLNSVTGHLNRTIRSLLENGSIVYTIPDKPNSRLQKYRLKKKE